MSHETPIKTQSGPDIQMISAPRGQMYVWEWPVSGVHYCAGVDSSQGVRGGDWSVIKVVRSDNLEEVCMWKGYIDPRELGRKAAWVGWLYNSAFLVVESNKDGQSVIWELKEMAYPNLFRTTTYDRIAGDQVIQKTIGFNTTLKTRPWLWNHMRLVVNHNWGRINSAEQIREMKQVRYDDKGIPTHPRMGHDDETIAWGLALVGRDQAFARGEVETEKKSPTDFDGKHWATFEEEVERSLEGLGMFDGENDDGDDQPLT